MQYHFKVYKEDNGYWASCIELEGCHSQGDTIEELKKNLEDALNLYLDEPSNSRIVFPQPDTEIKGDDIISVKVDPHIAFANYLRMIRITHKMTQKEAAHKLGYKSTWAYQKLESSSKTNPELKTISKIKEVFPEFDVNLIFI
jgi:predicted RNase H-like HicB family nuclease/DNA-binding XRE family transcriptional regulator